MTFLIYEDYSYDSAKLSLKAEYPQFFISVHVTLFLYPSIMLILL